MHEEEMTLEQWQESQAKLRAEEAARHASFIEWLAAQPASFKALADELFEMQSARKMAHGFVPSIRAGKDGRPIFVIRCANGHHESDESHEHALELLLDSHRTRIEDLESTHETARAALRKTQAGREAIAVAREEVVQRRHLSRRPPLPEAVRDHVAEMMAARVHCAELGRRIKAENPSLAGPERDALVRAALDAFVADAERENSESPREVKPERDG